MTRSQPEARSQTVTAAKMFKQEMPNCYYLPLEYSFSEVGGVTIHSEDKGITEHMMRELAALFAVDFVQQWHVLCIRPLGASFQLL